MEGFGDVSPVQGGLSSDISDFQIDVNIGARLQVVRSSG